LKHAATESVTIIALLLTFAGCGGNSDRVGEDINVSNWAGLEEHRQNLEGYYDPLAGTGISYHPKFSYANPPTDFISIFDDRSFEPGPFFSDGCIGELMQFDVEIERVEVSGMLGVTYVYSAKLADGTDCLAVE